MARHTRFEPRACRLFEFETVSPGRSSQTQLISCISPTSLRYGASRFQETHNRARRQKRFERVIPSIDSAETRNLLSTSPKMRSTVGSRNIYTARLYRGVASIRSGPGGLYLSRTTPHALTAGVLRPQAREVAPNPSQGPLGPVTTFRNFLPQKSKDLRSNIHSMATSCVRICWTRL
jgi:hypothetical protein